jgi:hypothetical protein
MKKLPKRFTDKFTINEETDCWEWQASKNVGGYGQFYYCGGPKVAHKVAYELMVGKVPQGLQLDHLCRVRYCCNPRHLEVVTSGENTRRGDNWQRDKTHCKHGHEFNNKNTYIRPGTTRRDCKKCKYLRNLKCK